MSKPLDRRTFLKKATAAGVGLGVLGGFSTVRGKSAPNNKVVVAIAGLHGRGGVHAQSFGENPNAEIAYICDVDSRVVEQRVAQVQDIQGKKPKGITDFREALDDKSVDALVIATPDHWHTPMAIYALKAGKHVYVEKPCGQNPREGELLVAAQKKYRKVVQMGNQQRSALKSIQAINDLRDGIIGTPYYARAWYANDRDTIGHGVEAPVPEWLDWKLWQGPAPHIKYRDNLVHYNWHWFWRWGTGEVCNNGTHEIDVARWALDVDYPSRVDSGGGRYAFDDDWEFFDTQMITYQFGDDKTITWQGRSCNPRPVEGRGRGTAVHGTKGTLIVDRNGYVVYDMDNKEVKNVTGQSMSKSMDVAGGGSLTDMHIQNFLDAIRDDVEPHSPIDEGAKSVLMCHLGNIAQKLGRQLDIDPHTGRIRDDEEAMKMWSREYEIGWEPTV